MYYLIMPSLEKRQALISFLKSRGILSVFHYVPLHLSLMGQRMGGRNGGCPVSEQKSERLIRLPFYNSLNQGDQDQVIAAVRQFQP
jgi:dTDP-4-amino-4,6-dideoxygalactose transaminase